MQLNKIGSKVIIPTIIIFRNFASINWLNYELVIYEWDNKD